MKWASLGLFGVLALLHWREGVGATALPLSMFRDGNQAWLGYAAFALLILTGAVVAHAACRCGEFLTCFVYAVAIVMLIAIAVTPSFDPFHLLISLLLPLMLYAYYLVLLHSELSSWMFLHLFIPLLLMFAIHFHSFGAWQKCMIMYFVLLANVHYRFLPHPVRKKTRKRSISKINRDLERLMDEGWIDRKAAPRAQSVRPSRPRVTPATIAAQPAIDLARR